MRLLDFIIELERDNRKRNPRIEGGGVKRQTVPVKRSRLVVNMTPAVSLCIVDGVDISAWVTLVEEITLESARIQVWVPAEYDQLKPPPPINDAPPAIPLPAAPVVVGCTGQPGRYCKRMQCDPCAEARKANQ